MSRAKILEFNASRSPDNGDTHWASIILGFYGKNGQHFFTMQNTRLRFAPPSFYLLVFSFALLTTKGRHAGVAQLVEQLICNHQVGGSNPFVGSRIAAAIGDQVVRIGID